MTDGDEPLFRGSDPGFEDELDRLKRRGCTFLVTGPLPQEAYRQLARKQLGDIDHEDPRVRVLVRFEDTDDEPWNWLPEGDVDRNHVVDALSVGRDAAVAAEDTAPTGPDAYASVVDEVRTIAHRRSLSPGQLRVAVWPLDLHQDDASLRRLAERLQSVTLEVSGMSFIYSPDLNDLAPQVVGDVVDGTVRNRLDTSGEFLEQHWLLDTDDTDRTYSSGWFPLHSVEL